MYTWIIYDISLDKARLKTAKLCQQLGLRRVQKSVFLGKVKKRKLEHFRQEVVALVDEARDRVFIFQSTEKAVKKKKACCGGRFSRLSSSSASAASCTGSCSL